MSSKIKMTPAQEIKRVKKLVRQILKLKIVRLIAFLFILSILAPLLFFSIVKPKPAQNIVWGVNFSQKYATDLGLDWKDAYIKILGDLKPKYARLVVY